jgi:VanZ family protein
MIPLKKFLPGIAWFFLVLLLICLPGDDLPKAANWMSYIFFDKWVHAGLFAVLNFLFIFPVARSPLPKTNRLKIITKIALAACVWGLTTEFIQKFFIPGRAFDLLDWGADSLGVGLALVVCWKLYLK